MGLGRENAGVLLHHEVVPDNHVPVHLGLVELFLEDDFLAKVRAGQFVMVHELQRNLSFLRTSDHLLAIGYIRPDGSPTCGTTLWRKQASIDKTDLGTCVNHHVEDLFCLPAQGMDLQVKVPLPANPAHGLQAENLLPFQKINQRLVQILGNGLWQPICSVQLRSG